MFSWNCQKCHFKLFSAAILASRCLRTPWLIVNYIPKVKVRLTGSKYTILRHLTKTITGFHFLPIDFHGLPPPPPHPLSQKEGPWGSWTESLAPLCQKIPRSTSFLDFNPFKPLFIASSPKKFLFSKIVKNAILAPFWPPKWSLRSSWGLYAVPLMG